MQGRVDCGNSVGTQAACIQDQCCYEITGQAGVPDCYFPAGELSCGAYILHHLAMINLSTNIQGYIYDRRMFGRQIYPYI